MGFLTDPNADNYQKVLKLLAKKQKRLCAFLYFGGVAWFFGYCVFNSESPSFAHNAFLTGLAREEFTDGQLIADYHGELLNEIRGNSMPQQWLVEKFQEMGIEAYAQNFTINDAMSGKNVYAILRTPRGYSNEAIVLSAPFRLTTTASTAFLLTFAEFAKKKNYIAKDIIFLITEKDELGTQAWLESYFETPQAKPLPRRSGNLLSAINFEFHNVKIGHVDLKIEGLNGRLPNLDIYESARKLLENHGIKATFKNQTHQQFQDPMDQWWYYLQLVSQMILTHASGIPRGNHGIFLGYGIHSLTLEGYSAFSTDNVNSIGRAVEAILRTHNNLVQGFHQSFFFYVLTSPLRMIPIGMYIASVAMMAGSLFVKAVSKWMQLQNQQQNILIDRLIIGALPFNIIIDTWFLFLALHFLCFSIMNCIKFMIAFNSYNVEDEATTTTLSIMTFSACATTSLALLFIPRLVSFKNCEWSISLLNILALLELGTALLCIAMTNISLALCCSIVYVPFALYAIELSSSCSPFANFLSKLLCLSVHPMIVLVMIVIAFTPIDYNVNMIDLISKAFFKSIVYNRFYGHWLFTIFIGVFLPNWLCFWIVSFQRDKSAAIKSKQN